MENFKHASFPHVSFLSRLKGRMKLVQDMARNSFTLRSNTSTVRVVGLAFWRMPELDSRSSEKALRKNCRISSGRDEVVLARRWGERITME